MPPKFKFTREEIVAAALELTRERGIDALTARALADRLGSSAKPIFSLFSGMEELHRAVLTAADALYHERLRADMERSEYPPYKASGMSYIRFAREERALFRLLFMRDRSHEPPEEPGEELLPLIRLIRENTGLSEQDAYRFHLESWIYVHGIATMLATAYLEWDTEFISRALTDMYLGLRLRYGVGEGV